MENTEGRFSGIWKGGEHTVSVNIPLIIFEDTGSKIVYCPALEVTGYGNTEPEAFDSFKISLGEFLRYTINKKTFRAELTRLGWQLKKSKTKPMTPPKMTVLLENNTNFSNIFNNFPFRKVNEAITLPA